MKKMLLQLVAVLCVLSLVGCASNNGQESGTAVSGPASVVQENGIQPAADGSVDTDTDLAETTVYEGTIAEVGDSTIGLQRIETTLGENGVDMAAGGFDEPIDEFSYSADTEISVRNVSRATEEVTISTGSAEDLKVGSTAYIFTNRWMSNGLLFKS